MMMMVMALLTTVLSLILTLCVTSTTLVHHSTTIHLIAATRVSGSEVKELTTQREISFRSVMSELYIYRH
jgi:hypothetical protein